VAGHHEKRLTWPETVPVSLNRTGLFGPGHLRGAGRLPPTLPRGALDGRGNVTMLGDGRNASIANASLRPSGVRFP